MNEFIHSRIGIQVLYSGILWPHPARVTRIHQRWGAVEAQIFVFKFLPRPVFEPRTLQSNGRERYHSTTAHQTHTQLLTRVLFAIRLYIIYCGASCGRLINSCTCSHSFRQVLHSPCLTLTRFDRPCGCVLFRSMPVLFVLLQRGHYY